MQRAGQVKGLPQEIVNTHFKYFGREQTRKLIGKSDLCCPDSRASEDRFREVEIVQRLVRR